ncbi:L,D-transpeptidase family protein [Aurantiacibacter aquimixticola]|uniref:Murein L,D-transpeptidase n=1 Tax=Aurantiacibacter aquimixticola TaxID=1958945 RepID=A0A419RU98_9SPHN|nr:L,D-transpeptidase family protein [Aurantiacibacter aquimixticola]RJY09324.1 murein L,D-transpeptidase [Aurantiacibacter aquimixticola]
MKTVRRTLQLALLAGCVLAGSANVTHARSSADEVTSARQDREVTPERARFVRELRREVDGEYDRFYSRRGYWPLWVVDGEVTGAATALIRHLETVQLDGLNPRLFDTEELSEKLYDARTGDAKEQAEAEIALSRAFTRYVQALGQESGEVAYYSDTVRPGARTVSGILRRAALAEDFDTYVAEMGWMHPLYVALRRILAESSPDDYNQIVIVNGPLLRTGDEGVRVRRLRERLSLSEGDVFDEDLRDALAAFQRSRNLTADGTLGPQTVAALNSTARRTDPAAIRRNMARAAELPGPDRRHILVNAASQTLSYYDGGKEIGRMRVIVGSQNTPTPMMAGLLSVATLNPYWNVPVDLVERIIAPAVLRGNSLDAMGYEVLSDWTADAEKLNWRNVDWRGAANGATELRVRELPGSGNAMGSVKYMFPNDQGIYLHDTDNRALFRRDDRFISNGCVRLEDAAALGEWLFGTMPEAEGDAPEQHVTIPDPVPVYITYMTAEPTADGRIAYYDDTYNRDTAPVYVWQ